MSVWEALGELDKGQPRMGEQLICALREAIEAGRLTPGTRLPSTRDLAADLGVSRGLVVNAYERLVAEGRLVTRRGSGTLVTSQVEQMAASGASGWSEHVAQRQPRPETGTGASGRAGGWSRLRSAAARTMRVPAPPGFTSGISSSVVPLRPGVPDPGLFPRAAWRRAYERALATAADADFDRPQPAGAFRLRAELAAYLSRIRAARADVDRILVTTGAAQGVALVASVLRATGVTRVAVEDPGSSTMRDRLICHGLEPVAVPVDAEGIDVAAMASAGVGAALVTPAHQYPTGVLLGPARRTALLEWARTTGGLIIEHDYDAEFRYDREPVGCLQGLAPEHVVLVGSASGALSPALRLGWLVVPAALREDLLAAKLTADGGGPTVEHLAFAELLGSGYDRHLRRARRVYRERRSALVTALRSNMPWVTVLGVPAGLHLCVDLPSGVDDVAIAAAAGAAGLAPGALSQLCCPGTRRSGLVMGFAPHLQHELFTAVGALAAITGRVCGGRPQQRRPVAPLRQGPQQGSHPGSLSGSHPGSLPGALPRTRPAPGANQSTTGVGRRPLPGQGTNRPQHTARG